MSKANLKFKECIWVILCIYIILLNGCKSLSEAPTTGLGVVDEEELKVLKEAERLEARLEALRIEVRIQAETSYKKLSDLQAAKEGVEKDFADTKNELEGKIKSLLGKVTALESKLSDTEARAAETKVQQELYTLKIDNLKQEEE